MEIWALDATLTRWRTVRFVKTWAKPSRFFVKTRNDKNLTSSKTSKRTQWTAKSVEKLSRFPKWDHYYHHCRSRYTRVTKKCIFINHKPDNLDNRSVTDSAVSIYSFSKVEITCHSLSYDIIMTPPFRQVPNALSICAINNGGWAVRSVHQQAWPWQNKVLRITKVETSCKNWVQNATPMRKQFWFRFQKAF